MRPTCRKRRSARIYLEQKPDVRMAIYESVIQYYLCNLKLLISNFTNSDGGCAFKRSINILASGRSKMMLLLIETHIWFIPDNMSIYLPDISGKLI